MTIAVYTVIATAIPYSAGTSQSTESGAVSWQGILKLALIAPLMLFPPQVMGQVYKCKDPSGKFVYSDRPCDAKTESVRKLDSPAYQPDRTERYGSNNSLNTSDGQRLDTAVKSAIASRDFRHARELALTPMHWEWIKEAEKPPKKTEANLRWEQLNSQECKQAQRSFDIEASSVKRNLAEIERKRQRELSACGGYIKAR